MHADVRYWPIADILSCTAHVRFRGQSGHSNAPAREWSQSEIALKSERAVEVAGRSNVRVRSKGRPSNFCREAF